MISPLDVLGPPVLVDILRGGNGGRQCESININLDMCESVFRIQGIQVYKNIRYGAFTSGGQEHELRSQG